MIEAPGDDVLTAHKRGGRAGDHRRARQERVLGPLWLPPPFSVVLASFHFSSEIDGVSVPQAVRGPQPAVLDKLA